MDSLQALNALTALSHETRLDVFRLLVKAGPSGLCAGDIATQLEVRQNTLSTHLNSLTQSGLVSRQRNGRSIVYSAVYPQMRELIVFLMKDCCQNNATVCAPFNATANNCR